MYHTHPPSEDRYVIYSLICAENMPILTLTDRGSISILSLTGRVSIEYFPHREGKYFHTHPWEGGRV